MKKCIGISVILAVILLQAPILGADQDSFSTLVFSPMPGRGPYYHLSDTHIGEPLQLHVGNYLDYARTAFKAPVGATTQSINKRMLTDHLLFDINATKFLQFGLDLPFVFYHRFMNPANALIGENQFDLGDPLVMIKGEILDPVDFPIGLAVIPYVSFPLGNGGNFTGTNEITPGAKIALEKKWEKVSLNLNLGYLLHNNVTRVGVNIDDMFTFGLGTAIQLPRQFTLVAEVDGRTVAKDFFERKIQSPVQVTATLRKGFDSGFSVEAGGGAGISRGAGSPLGHGFIGIACTEDCFHRKDKDQDGDGVMDRRDECPKVAGPSSNKGCPESDIKVTEAQIETPTIYFQFGKSTLKPEGKAVLDRLVDAVKARPRLKGLRIEGHTDTIGGRAMNLRLSKERAAAVKSYLAKSIGIYLESEGYGFDKPVADNKTATGRTKNRRVEFLIIDK